MALKKGNSQEADVREFNEFLEAQEVFEDNNESEAQRLHALDYIIRHKEIFYVLRMVSKLFATNSVGNHVFIDYAFSSF
jgi:hypothetical protein